VFSDDRRPALIVRLAHAYGVAHAVVGSMLMILVGLGLGPMTLGVSRQPLPLVWPLAVLHVVVAQLPLREILGPAERIAVRGPLTRGARVVIVQLLLLTGPFTYVVATGERLLLVFFLLLTAAGFTAAALSRAEPWAWTLGLGMTVVGLAFVTALGSAVNRGLECIPVPVASLLVVAASCLYVARPVSGRR
jgi:hypothetical protein